jgi:hypothetical protein
MSKRTPAHIGQFAQRRLSGTRSQDQLLGDDFAALMVAAIRQDGADLVKHNIQIGLGTFIEVAHGLPSNAAKLAPGGVMRSELNQT